MSVSLLGHILYFVRKNVKKNLKIWCSEFQEIEMTAKNSDQLPFLAVAGFENSCIYVVT